MIFIMTLAFAPAGAALNTDLQQLIDAAEDNAILQPPPGIYAGPIIIDKPITLDGRGEVTIDAGGKGSVVLLDTDGATLQRLKLINSGSSHNDID